MDLKIIRINTRGRSFWTEPVPGDFETLGGRAFTSRWVFRHGDPECDPLERKNPLVIAPGMLAGTPASSVHRSGRVDDSHERKGQVEASGRMQVNGMIYDSLGICLYAHVAVKERHDILAGMVNGRWGIKWSARDLREIAIRALGEEKEFNRRAGLGPATDRLPEIFSEEANPSSGTTFDFSPEELDAIEYH